MFRVPKVGQCVQGISEAEKGMLLRALGSWKAQGAHRAEQGPETIWKQLFWKTLLKGENNKTITSLHFEKLKKQQKGGQEHENRLNIWAL